MLQRPFWHAKNAMVLTMHGGHSWSGPAGWEKCLRRLFGRRHIAGRLWYLLSTLSLLATVALPLSGLSVELFDGYLSRSADKRQTYPMRDSCSTRGSRLLLVLRVQRSVFVIRPGPCRRAIHCRAGQCWGRICRQRDNHSYCISSRSSNLNSPSEYNIKSHRQTLRTELFSISSSFLIYLAGLK
jgi:hypothetical protein